MASSPATFPREFQRKYLISLDRDFLIILLFSAVAVIFFIQFFRYRFADYVEPAQVPKLHHHYATMMLSREMEQKAAKLEKVPPAAIMTTTAEAGEGLLGGGGTMAGRGEEGAAAVRSPAVSEMAPAARSRTGEVSGSGSEMGVLGLLGRGSGYINSEYIDGVIAEGDLENSRLDEALSSLAGIQAAPRTRIAGGRIRPGESRGVLGGRRGKEMTLDDLLGDLQPSAQLGYREIGRAEEFETVKSSVPVKPAPPRNAEERAKLRRTAEQVQAVINGHRPAIIDCYKQLLKRDPEVKGKIEIRFAVDPDGRVIRAEIVQSTIDDIEMQQCILNRVRRWNDFGYGDPTTPEQVFRQTFTFGY